MGGPRLCSCFILVVIIQHNDTVSGGHGGSNPPKGGRVGKVRVLEGKGPQEEHLLQGPAPSHTLISESLGPSLSSTTLKQFWGQTSQIILNPDPELHPSISGLSVLFSPPSVSWKVLSYSPFQ